MLSDACILAMQDRILELTEPLVLSIVQDMARRIGKMNYATDTALWQLQKLKAMGLEYNYILQELATFTGKNEKTIAALFLDAGASTLAIDDEIYRAV